MPTKCKGSKQRCFDCGTLGQFARDCRLMGRGKNRGRDVGRGPRQGHRQDGQGRRRQEGCFVVCDRATRLRITPKIFPYIGCFVTHKHFLHMYKRERETQKLPRGFLGRCWRCGRGMNKPCQRTWSWRVGVFDEERERKKLSEKMTSRPNSSLTTPTRILLLLGNNG